jgi:trigger factor
VDISIPVEEVEAETGRAVANVQKKARLQGFRPGKAPAKLVRKYYESDIRQQVLETLVPKYVQKHIEEERLSVVGTPDVKDVHLHDGEPLNFKAEFEVMPEIELNEYRGLTVKYEDPAIMDEDVDKRIAELREQKAEYVNVDPKLLEDGDFAVISIESLGLTEADAVRNEEMTVEIGGKETLEAFTENLRGAAPGDEKEFEVAYPENYGQPKLAGKTVRFKAVVKGVRRKELPEVDDDFAQDLGDYRDVAELRDAVQKALFAQRQLEAQREAKDKLVEQLVDSHEFPVPEVFVDRQIRNRVEQSVRSLAAEGLDPRQLRLDWEKIRDSQKDRAVREVKASLILSKIAEREGIAATRDEVDREVERLARQQREPIAAVRMRLEKDGTLGRIASHIETEKTLSHIFEHARKTAD